MVDRDDENGRTDPELGENSIKKKKKEKKRKQKKKRKKRKIPDAKSLKGRFIVILEDDKIDRRGGSEPRVVLRFPE